MAGLVPAIHVLFRDGKDVDARHKAGHDVDGVFLYLLIGQNPVGIMIEVFCSKSSPDSLSFCR